MNTSLFRGRLIYFAPPDPDRDAEIEAQWSQDPEYLQLVSAEPVRPLFTAQVKKQYEEYDKNPNSRFRFHLRTLDDDRLVGFIDMKHIEWSNRISWLSLGIGKKEDRSRGYGAEALRMMLRYAFDELMLYRISAFSFEYNVQAIDLLQKNGFQIEVRMREAIHRFNRRWDALILGILTDDWRRIQPAGEGRS